MPRRLFLPLFFFLLLLGPPRTAASDVTRAVVRVYAGRGAGSGSLICCDEGRGWVLTDAPPAREFKVSFWSEDGSPLEVEEK